MLLVENNFNKMAYLMFTLGYFDVSGFLEVVYSHFSELYVLAVCFRVCLING